MGESSLYALQQGEEPRQDVVGSDRMVQKCLDIAAQLGCPYFMENPHTGLLKGRAVVAGIPYRVVDYCKYHDHRCTHRAQKRTAIWTNTDWMPSRSLCLKDCGHCEGNRHRARMAGPRRVLDISVCACVWNNPASTTPQLRPPLQPRWGRCRHLRWRPRRLQGLVIRPEQQVVEGPRSQHQLRRTEQDGKPTVHFEQLVRSEATFYTVAHYRGHDLRYPDQ